MSTSGIVIVSNQHTVRQFQSTPYDRLILSNSWASCVVMFLCECTTPVVCHVFNVVDGRRALSVAELQMTSRHHQLITELAKANEDIQRASVVTIETQIAANKESCVLAQGHFYTHTR